MKCRYGPSTSPRPSRARPVPALDGVSLTVGSGELVALLGPSGGGKTTLLRIIAGLDIPTSGKVFFGDEDASQKTVQERRVGFVFQSYALFKHLTVEENIAFGLDVRDRASRPPKEEIRRRALELLDLVQLSGLAGRRPAQLSGGQRQRVALARALAVEPRVLLLDEPFGALDAKVRRELRSWLRELHAQTGHTTIFVTHDQDEALELADRVAVLNGGRIEQIGTPDEIYDHPATAFVNSFIGEAGALHAHLRDGQVYVGLPPGDAARRVETGERRRRRRPAFRASAGYRHRRRRVPMRCRPRSCPCAAAARRAAPKSRSAPRRRASRSIRPPRWFIAPASRFRSASCAAPSSSTGKGYSGLP